MIFIIQKIIIFVFELPDVYTFEQPVIVSSVLLVKKPLSVHCTWIDSSFTQHRLVIQFHEQYSTNTTRFMSVKCKEILMLEKSKSRGKRINMYS